jgi:hypothetical protein
MLSSLVGSLASSFIFVVVSIFLMFLLLLRSLRAALIALVPNVLPVFFVLGTMGWARIHLDMATVMIASVSFGIAVDGTIHYLVRCRWEARRHPLPEALRRSHGSIGIAILATCLVTMAGFGTLALSNFRPNWSFGLLSGIAIAVGLCCTLTLLPALLLVAGPYRGTPDAAGKSEEGGAAPEAAAGVVA